MFARTDAEPSVMHGRTPIPAASGDRRRHLESCEAELHINPAAVEGCTLIRGSRSGYSIAGRAEARRKLLRYPRPSGEPDPLKGTSRMRRSLLLACSALGVLLAVEPVAAKTLDWDGTLTLDLGPLGSSTSTLSSWSLGVGVGVATMNVAHPHEQPPNPPALERLSSRSRSTDPVTDTSIAPTISQARDRPRSSAPIPSPTSPGQVRSSPSHAAPDRSGAGLLHRHLPHHCDSNDGARPRSNAAIGVGGTFTLTTDRWSSRSTCSPHPGPWKPRPRITQTVGRRARHHDDRPGLASRVRLGNREDIQQCRRADRV